MADQLIHFGKLSLLYDNGFVRYIRAGDVEIVRNIYFALRDNNWATAPIIRSDERILVTPKSFEIAYTATNVVEDKEVFRWHVRITGSESGEIDFSVDGECLDPYNRNRAGICVLHPVRDTRGKSLLITRPDGSTYESKFPSIINPYQPFLDIRKMRWPLVNDVWAELQFEGDVFETEDQRNWGDDSFKTYSTPLTVPYPVMLKPGDKVDQRVKLRLINEDHLPAADLDNDIEVTIDERSTHVFPKIEDEHSFVCLVVDSVEDWNTFAAAGPRPITKLAICPFDRKANIDELLNSILPKARKLFPQAEIGAGFTTYFTELNRNRFDYSRLDFLIYPVTPQAHLSDLHTVIENLPAQKDQVESAKAFAPGKKIHVGPVTLTSVPDRIAAGWMLGSLKYLSEGGADCVTTFESNGYLKMLLDLKPGKVVTTICNEPLALSSLLIESGNGQRHLILINHTHSNKSVTAFDALYTLSEYEIRFIVLK